MELKAIAVRIVALAATYTCFLAGSVGATGPVDTCPSASWKVRSVFFCVVCHSVLMSTRNNEPGWMHFAELLRTWPKNAY